jgi:hypothetical protein
LADHIANVEDGNAHVAIVNEIDRLDVPARRLTSTQESRILARMVARWLRRAVRPAVASPVLPAGVIHERILDIECRYPGPSGVAVRALAPDVFIISGQGDE